MQSNRGFFVARLVIIVVGVLKDDRGAAAKVLAQVEQPWRGFRAAVRLYVPRSHQEIYASVAQAAPHTIVRGLGLDDTLYGVSCFSSWNGPDRESLRRH